MATNGTLFGVYQSTGTGTAAAICAGAFDNPLSLDLIQIINEGGTVVWNLTSVGVSNTNPASPTKAPSGAPLALFHQRFGTNLAAAIASPAEGANGNPQDLLQIVAYNGQGLLLHVSNTGTVTTP